MKDVCANELSVITFEGSHDGTKDYHLVQHVLNKTPTAGVRKRKY